MSDSRPVEIARQKAELRRAMADPAAPAREHAQAAGEAATSVIVATAEYQGAATLGLFAALSSEIATRPLFERARADGKACLLPRCVVGDELEFARVDRWSELESGRLGILEPSASAGRVDVALAQLVIVPGLAFDISGGRLGRGRGFYDRALATLSERTVVFGLGFGFQLVEAVPVESHDFRVHGFASEAGLTRVR